MFPVTNPLMRQKLFIVDVAAAAEVLLWRMGYHPAAPQRVVLATRQLVEGPGAS